MNYPKESGIYIIRNIHNGKVYIGQSQNVDYRIRMHKCLLNNNKHYNPHLQAAWNKYGSTSFEISILELCTISQLNEKEISYIKQFNSFRCGYNQTVGGEGIRGTVMSDESKAKMRASHFDCKRGNHPQARSVVLLNTGEVFSCVVDAAEKYGISKCDISGCAKGDARSAGAAFGERLVWVYLENYQTISDDEIADLIYNAQNCKRGAMSPHSKAVICTSTGEVFRLIEDAATHYGVSRSCIGAACSGKQKTAAKHPVTGQRLEWKYYDEYLNSYANDSSSSCLDMVAS